MKISKKRIKEIIREENDRVLTESELKRVRSNLQSIRDSAAKIQDLLESQESENVEEWVQEDVAVANAMLKAIFRYEKDEKVKID
jgi:hypothetical protein